MILLGSRSKIYVATEPVDFRRGFSKLSSIVRNVLHTDPLSGHIFIFRNKHSNAVKMICFDGWACWTIHAKFAKGKLNWWPEVAQINAAQLMGLLSQSSKVEVSEAFRDVF